MKILAIDTVTEMCSAALLIDGEIHFREELAPQQHTRLILRMIDELIAESGIQFSDLDAIGFSRGPASFTGLRICASVTQGLALAHDLPVIPISSLAILGQGALRLDQQTRVMACIDARKDEVYCACFEESAGIMQAIGEEQVESPTRVTTPMDINWHGVGSGFLTYADELNDNSSVNVTTTVAERYPLARDILPIAQSLLNEQKTVDASLALPVYLRDNIAKPPKAKGV